MGGQIVLTELPRDGFGFVCRELINRIEQHNNMMKTFYAKFDMTKNLKQLAVYQTLADPMLPIRNCNRIQHVCLRGSVGSGKSTMGIAWPIMMMHKYPGSTWLGMRRTEATMMASLFETIVKFNEMFDIPYKTKQKSSSGPAEIRYPNGSKWVFWSSESVVESTSADNARGLGSMEYSGAVIEEADTVHKEAIDTIPQRCRENSGVPFPTIFYILNPTQDTHYLAQMFQNRHLNDHPEDYHDFKSTMYDNAYWLPPGYIESQEARYKNNPALYRRMVLGEWGPELKGTPIFGRYYDPKIHVAKKSFIDRWQKDSLWMDGDVCLCWDFGFVHPCLVVFQDVRKGDFQQLRFLYCHLGHNITLGSFAGLVLNEVKLLFPGANYMCYADDAGKQKDPRGVTNVNALDVLRKFGLHPLTRPNSKDKETAEVQLIIDLLQKNVPHKQLGLQPAIIIEPNEKYTQDIQDMFEIGFAQPDDLPKDELKPFNDKYYIHIADATRAGVGQRRQLVTAPSPFGHRPEYQSRYTLDPSTGLYLSEAESLEYETDLSAYYGFGNGAYDRWHP